MQRHREGKFLQSPEVQSIWTWGIWPLLITCRGFPLILSFTLLFQDPRDQLEESPSPVNFSNQTYSQISLLKVQKSSQESIVFSVPLGVVNLIAPSCTQRLMGRVVREILLWPSCRCKSAGCLQGESRAGGAWLRLAAKTEEFVPVRLAQACVGPG